ncbi:MAG TPA: SDR family oxidoreductase [Xanthobacteraceae bacterium]|nr:SDR family oxidoreductase [Xanthobacteraceae bacterium]
MSHEKAKTILITGAASGFGRDTAETLARAGHTVFASMRDVNGKHRDQANDLRKQSIAVVELDVSDDASVDAAVKEVLSRTGRVDVLVNNAGIASAGITEAFTADQAKVIFNTNVVGLLRTSRAVLPTMRAQGDGLIINIGSILGRVTFPFFGIYGASKFAVEALTESLRYEVSQLGVDIVLVQPSAYPTNMYAAIQQPADAGRAAGYGAVAEIPGKMFETFMGMFASANAPNPHDVAGAIAKLIATPKGARAARLVVGQAFGADAVNDAVAPIQHRVVEGLGLGALTILAKQAA